MADGTKVGSAYVEVTPKAAGNFKSSFEKQMPDGKAPGKKFGGGFSTAAKGALGALSVAAGNILSNVATNAVSTLTDTFSQAFEGFANYEQLTGGVEKLFGAEAAKTVQANAEKAFSAAGVSANDYMEQVTSFSAALIGSLEGDTQTAANMADMAMRDMSDNANTFGTDIASIQNAYQGFAKGNFTMLDNLKLGYGGTKEEMQRLLTDAEQLGGLMEGSLKMDNFADIVEAIDIVQEHMNISGLTAEQAAEMVASGALTEEEALKRMGTTAREGSTTVSGSINAMKAAWENWLTALGRDDVDLGAVTDQLIQSIGTAAQNAIPVAARIVQSMGETIVAYAPVLFDSALVAMSQIAQAAPSATPQVVAGILALASQGAMILVQAAPQFVSGAFAMMGGVVAGIVNSIPTVLATAVQMIPQLAGQIAAGAGQMLGAGLAMFLPLGEALNNVAEQLAEAVVYIVTHLPEIVMNGIGGMIEAGKSFFGGLVDGFLNGAPQIEAGASEATESAVQAAEGSADASSVSEKLVDSMTTSFDASELTAKVEAGTADAVEAAKAGADAAPVAVQLTDTAVAAMDMTAMNDNAVKMSENAVEAAKSVDFAAIGRELSEQAAGGIDVDAMSGQAAELAKSAAANLNTTSTVSVKADLSGVNAMKAAAASLASTLRSTGSAGASAMKQVSSAASSAAAPFKSLASSVSSAMSSARDSASKAASSIKSSINSIPSSKTFTLSFSKPSIPVPHYSISGSLDPKNGSVPTVSAYWAAEGAIFTKATLFGAGEAGPEAVLPLSKLPGLLGLDERGRGDVVVNLNYTNDADAERMARDIARSVQRYRLAGAF